MMRITLVVLVMVSFVACRTEKHEPEFVVVVDGHNTMHEVVMQLCGMNNPKEVMGKHWERFVLNNLSLASVKTYHDPKLGTTSKLPPAKYIRPRNLCAS